MVVIVMNPDLDGLSSLVFKGITAEIEALAGQDPLVALDIPFRAKGLAVRSDVADLVQCQPFQSPRHRPHAACEAVPFD